jgi:transcriptional regulator with XRE-family HTH domain
MFHDLFKKLCAQKGVSMTQALSDMNLSTSYLSTWKRSDPKPHTAKILSDYFRVPVTALTETETPEELLSVTEEEARLIRMYRTATEEQKAIIRGRLYEYAIDRDEFYKKLARVIETGNQNE